MSLDTYRVTCKHGHDEIQLAGADALAHVQQCYGRKTITSVPKTGTGWERARRASKPAPWVAPKPDKDGLVGVMRKLAAGEYDHAAEVAECEVDGWEAPTEGLWRWDTVNAQPLPLHLLPVKVREILTAVQATPDARWLLRVKHDIITVVVADTPDSETRIDVIGARVKVMVGRDRVRVRGTITEAYARWVERAA